VPQILSTLSLLLDTSRPILSADDVAGLTADSRDAFLNQKLLVPARTATHVVCDACHEDHVEQVTRIKSAKGDVSFRIRCPDAGWVIVPDERLRQWTIDVEQFVRLLANAVGAVGQISMIVTNRAWRLGKVKWQSAKREAIFTRGIRQGDSKVLAQAICRHGRAIVFVSARTPPISAWWRNRPAFVLLSHVATLGHSGIDIDQLGLASAVLEADAAADEAAADALDRKKLKDIVRKEVKADKKSELPDAAVLQAYRQHGSSRKAAAALTADGYQIDHSTVARIVRKFDEVDIARGDSSKSVVRTVASQRRDGKKKISNTTEALDYERDEEN
jgi:hypothetical protein